MKILITGVAGFIGSTLAGRLLREGNQVIGIDNFSGYYDRRLKDLNLADLVGTERFNMVEADLNLVDLKPLIMGADVIYHLAGQPGVRRSWGTEFVDYVDANVLATQRLLEAVRQYLPNLTRFIYASSSSVYGDAETFPTRESDRPLPRSPYGVTKLAGENLVSLYAANFGLPSTSLRYFTVYGPRQRPDMAFNRFISSARGGRGLEVHGDGTQVREFTYVDDIVEASILASVTPIEPGTVVNLSGGTSVSLNEVLTLLEQIHGTSLLIQRGPPALGDVLRTGGSTDRAVKLLGWQPKIGIEVGLEREYDWLAARDR